MYYAIQVYMNINEGDYMMNGEIRWFDGLRGEGVVRGEDGKSYFVHFTAIQGIDKNNHHWPTDADQLRLKSIDGLKCSYEVYSFGESDQVSNLILKGA
jgi:hypothetical protein